MPPFRNTKLPAGLGFLLILLFGPVSGQDTLRLEVTARIEGEFRNMATDPLQQLYLVDADQELIKLDPEGRELFRYNNFTLGRLGHVDATNPFSLLLYYPDFQAVVLLDRTLSQVGTVNLLDLDLPNAQAIALDSENLIWVYDPIRFMVKRLNIRGEVTLESENLALRLPVPPDGSFLLAQDNRLFLRDPQQGFFVLDNFGRLDRILPASESRMPDFQVSKDRLIYVSGDRLVQIYLSIRAREEAILPAGVVREALSFRVEQDLLYVLYPEQVVIYRIRY